MESQQDQVRAEQWLLVRAIAGHIVWLAVEKRG